MSIIGVNHLFLVPVYDSWVQVLMFATWYYFLWFFQLQPLAKLFGISDLIQMKYAHHFYEVLRILEGDMIMNSGNKVGNKCGRIYMDHQQSPIQETFEGFSSKLSLDSTRAYRLREKGHAYM